MQLNEKQTKLLKAIMENSKNSKENTFLHDAVLDLYFTDKPFLKEMQYFIVEKFVTLDLSDLLFEISPKKFKQTMDSFIEDNSQFSLYNYLYGYLQCLEDDEYIYFSEGEVSITFRYDYGWQVMYTDDDENLLEANALTIKEDYAHLDFLEWSTATFKEGELISLVQD